MPEEEFNQPLNVEPAPVAEPPKDIVPETVEPLPGLSTVPEPEKPAENEKVEKAFSKWPTYVLIGLTVIAVALVTIALVLSLR